MIPRSEIARYLGYGGAALSAQVSAFADVCEAELFHLPPPRKTGRRLAKEALPFLHDGCDLARHLSHCREVYLVAVTLGSEADRLLRLWSVQHMGKAAVGQACMAVRMDQCVDDYMQELEVQLPQGLYLTPPFSPGYGDFSLHWQKTLLRLLDASRRIGLALTEGGMLVPEKSVTAVVGVSQRNEDRCITTCQACEKKDCAFRKGAAT